MKDIYNIMSNKCCCYELVKCIMVNITTVFNIDNKYVLSTNSVY